MSSRFGSWVLTGIAALGAAACHHGGSGTPPTATNVVVSGTVTFDLVPTIPGAPGGGLDYASTRASPARGVTVEFVEGATATATTATDDNGDYSLTLPANRSGFLRVKAEMVRNGSPSWDITVLDNTSGDALYSLDGTPFDTGSADSVHDLHAASGWTGAGYGGARSAAPFAILDAVYDGVALVLGVEPMAAFPPLTLHWSPDNVPSTGSVDLTTGEIGSSFFLPPTTSIYLLGAEDSDTDEYDRHVILHEWGHYFEHAFSRTDSFGGPHTRGDLLDMRVAFGEGWGNAFSGLATGESVYRDVMGPRQASAPAFDLEGAPFFSPNPAPGWYSEESVQELIYDVADAADDGADTVTLGFGGLYDVLTGEQRTSVALTSIFPFVDALVARNPSAAASIDAMVQGQSIDPVIDAYGSTESHEPPGNNPDVLPIYKDLTINDPMPVNVCSTDAFSSPATDSVNKLGSRRLMRFNLGADASVTLTATATIIPAGEFADPDLVLHQAGTVLVSEDAPDAPCVNTTAPGWMPQDCVETVSTSLTAGDYVLEVYEWTNTLSHDDTTPPIGRTCFDVTVTEP